MRWGGLMLLLVLAGCASNPPRNLSASGNALSPEGWRGQRYYENGRVIGEEFDAVGDDGRIDLWRYYQDGSLLTEDRDRDSDGRIDYTAHYRPKTAALEAFSRDTDFDGQNDIWLRHLEDDRWALNWDRNRDGAVDFVFIFRCPGGDLAALQFDPTEVADMREVVPIAQWVEVDLDDDFDRRFDSWTRYKEGKASERGVDANGDGYPETWAKAGGKEPTKAAKDERRPAPARETERRARITGVEAAVEIPGKAAALEEEEETAADAGEAESAKSATNRRPRPQAKAEVAAQPAAAPRAPSEESGASAVPAALPPEEE
ncbi:MAG: hypothetical protein N3A66_09970 [Planctomycetota bacterium]|nr:hypothetical protein [Planctomycetota bacterium]